MSVAAADQAVISQMLIAIAREMGVKLVRSAYSTILREARDGSAALLDRNGQVVAQAELIPIQLGSIGATIRPCLETYPTETIGENEFLLTNDPFHGGQHLHDVFLFTPIFFERQLAGFAASVAHHVDLGGALDASASDVYQEGFIIPPTKFDHTRDWHGGPLERLIRANTRLPEQLVGDLNAQLAANAIGTARLQQMCSKYGLAAVSAVMTDLMDYSERRVRAAIRAVPNGVYHGAAMLDDDGIDDQPLTVHATVIIADETIAVDFAGTCQQVRRNLNCPFASTVSAALSCIKSVLTSPDIPFNEGVKRPVTVTAPLGSLLNPRPPAPSRSRMQAAYRAFNAVMAALAQAVPDNVIAQGFDTTTVASLVHSAQDGYRVSIEVFGGGYGASARHDGCDAVDSPLSNCSNAPVEALDMEYDFFRVIGYGLDHDSFGMGRQRGGAGFVRRYRILADDATFTLFSDHFRIPPSGLFRGEPGRIGHCLIYRNSEVIEVAGKSTHPLRVGDVIELHLGGGGGYGDPRERPRTLAEYDLAEGLLSRALATQYGLTSTPSDGVS